MLRCTRSLRPLSSCGRLVPSPICHLAPSYAPSYTLYRVSPRTLTRLLMLERSPIELCRISSNQLLNFEQRRHARNRYSGFRTRHPKPVTAWVKVYYLFLGCMVWIVAMTPAIPWALEKAGADTAYYAVKAASVVEDTDTGTKDDESGEVAVDDKREKIGFHDRKMMEYENRIRDYSTPDKIFRYFATIKMQQGGGYEVCMTPNDFVRSITPGMLQPEGLGLDKFIKYDPKKHQVSSNLREDSIFFKLGQSGLISFSDYVFLLVLLSTTPRMFEIAFKMFDLNGDGDVEFEEFQKVQSVMRSQTSVGMRHRDHTASTLKNTHTALTTYFFGPKHDKKLTVESFLEFQRQLQTEILWLEFQRMNPKNGLINERDFAYLLLLYAGLNEQKRIKMVKRVKKAFAVGSVGISFEDYHNFYNVLKYINDIDMALMFYNVAGASIDKATLKHVAFTVAHVRLKDHIIDVVFTLFDENNDGELSNKEFVSVVKRRMTRGLEKSKDTGFVKLLTSMMTCAGKTLHLDDLPGVSLKPSE